MIDDMMKQELPNLIDERRFRRREPEQFERDEFGRVSLETLLKPGYILMFLQRKWPEEKIPIDLEPIPGFNLRAQVVGSGGAYVKHVQTETRCRVQIKGRGSGFKDPNTGQEHDEPMYLHVAGPDPDMVQRAKELCIDLLENVKTEYEKFKERGAQNRGYGGGYGDRNDRGGNHGGYNRQYQDNYGGAQSPTAQTADPATAAAAAGDYAAQYAQYYGGQDPYAAYGGYQNYVAMYYQYYQQQGGASNAAAPTAGSPGAAPGTPTAPGSVPPPPASEAPPPPPPGGAAPPPPPPGGSHGAYGAV